MHIDVRPIRPDDFAAAHRLQCEYLDAETMDAFAQRVCNHSDLYMVAVDGDVVVGVCHGRPDPRQSSSVVLQGIAVNLDESRAYARRGIGSRMLGVFAAAAKARGCTRIGVGSADDPKVERFYLRNGFRAVQLVAKGRQGAELERVAVDDPASADAVRARMRTRHGRRAREVIVIFERDI